MVENSVEEKLPGDKYSERIRARFWITGPNSGYIGIGRVELLENIAALGSISRAAKAMGMSYKKAWKLVEELNCMYDTPLVIKEQGGKQGGGTTLTKQGCELIDTFRELEKRLQNFLTEESKGL